MEKNNEFIGYDKINRKNNYVDELLWQSNDTDIEDFQAWLWKNKDLEV
jgi:hypothetical protein